MAKLKLSKTSLQHQRALLKLYQKLLPSLDLKRRQLLLEQKKAQEALRAAEAAVGQVHDAIGAELPMLAGTQLALHNLVTLRAIRTGRESIAGVRVPRLDAVVCDVAPYSLLATPAWIDRLADRLQEAVALQVRVMVCRERLRILNHAVRRITQRVNLFERILIPVTKQTIKRIQIYLGDLEREAVIRSKLSKAKHA